MDIWIFSGTTHQVSGMSLWIKSYSVSSYFIAVMLCLKGGSRVFFIVQVKFHVDIQNESSYSAAQLGDSNF